MRVWMRAVTPQTPLTKTLVGDTGFEPLKIQLDPKPRGLLEYQMLGRQVGASRLFGRAELADLINEVGTLVEPNWQAELA